jgi:recombination endonuclease VII
MTDRCEEERKSALRRSPKPKPTAGDLWAKRIWLKYGLKPDDVALRWAEQDGRCPICEVDLTTKVWVIDHDHKRSGRPSFRGLLCSFCNHRIVSMAERGGFVRAVNVVRYLWPGRTAA